MAVFVGRVEELGRLERRLDRALAGDGGIVFVTGEAGAGKSAFVEHFLVQTALRVPTARVIGASCSEQYGAGEPYQPFVETFRDLVADPADGDEGGSGKRSLRELAGELAPYWVSAIPVAGNIITATMATAVELKRTFGGGVATVASPPSEEALFYQYTELFFAAAAQRPILLFIDDLHWADRASVSLLTHLARKANKAPVLIIGTYRAVDVDLAGHPLRTAKLELERYGAAEELTLPALERTALSELIRDELDGPPSPELVGWLEERAGSNPLFFGELLKWLIHQGIVERHKDEWRLARPPEEIEVPRSAASTIELRLSRLDPETYKILEYASIGGNDFDSTTLSQLLDMDELELEEAMDPIVRAHRLARLAETRDLPSGDITSVYQFSHALIRDVLQKNLQGKRRILLHRKIADILEGLYDGDVSPIVHKLAVHYDEGRLPGPAFDYAIRAAERASRVYAHWDAIGLLQRALRNAKEDAQKAEACERLADASWMIGRYPEALATFDEALAAAVAAGDRRRGLVVRRKSVVAQRAQGVRQPAELLERLAELEREAREAGANEEICQVLWHSMGFPGNEATRDHQRAEEALRIARQVDEPTLVAKAHHALGRLLVFGESPGDGIPHLRDALRLHTDLGDRSRAGRCHNELAIAHAMLGDYAAASADFDAAAAMFAEVGDPMATLLVRNNLGALLVRTGDWDRAESNLTGSIQLCERMDAVAQVLGPLQNLAELHQLRGEWEAARTRWAKLLDCARDAGYWDAEVVARCGLGLVALESGDLDAARAEEAEAQRLLTGRDEWNDGREAFQMFAARLAAESGEIDGALHLLDAAAEALASRDRFLWAVCQLEKGRLLLAAGRDGAVPLIEEAQAVFAALGAKPMQARTEALLTEGVEP